MANKITQQIPNAITSLNLFSGCMAILATWEGDFQRAAFFILLGAFFDFFDGMSARLLKAYSPMGKELDSLADCVTFGVAPALMVYCTLDTIVSSSAPTALAWTPYLAFLLAVFSALRLAKFNIDERQTTSFIGLPTPGNALFWIGICLVAPSISILSSTIYPILGLVFIFSFLLVCEIPMFSFKFKSYNWRENKIRYAFLSLAVVLIFTFGITKALPAVIGTYIALSILCSWASKKA